MIFWGAETLPFARVVRAPEQILPKPPLFGGAPPLQVRQGAFCPLSSYWSGEGSFQRHFDHGAETGFALIGGQGLLRKDMV